MTAKSQNKKNKSSNLADYEREGRVMKVCNSREREAKALKEKITVNLL